MSKEPSNKSLDDITPDMLMNDIRSTSPVRAGTISLVLHLILIGATSVGFIANGFKEPEPEKPAEKTEAKPAETEPEPPAAQPEEPAAEAPEAASAGDGSDGEAEGETKPKHEMSAIEKAVTEAAKPEDIQREPPKKISLDLDDVDGLE